MNEEQISIDHQQDVAPEAEPAIPSPETVLESDTPNTPTPDTVTPAEAEETNGQAEAIAALQKELADYRQELAEQSEQLETYKKRYISLAAEFDNFRKRTQREKEEQEKTIKGKTITELLPVVDNFERARTQIKPSTDGENDIHKSYQGVYKSLVDSLKRLGVAPLRPEGQPFDPLYHEAMLRQPTSEYAEGTVIEELVRGYKLDDIVLRHSMVKVAVPPEEGEAVSEATANEHNEGDSVS